MSRADQLRSSKAAPLATAVDALEKQLQVLKGEIERLRHNGQASKNAADLYGICAGQSECTEEDLAGVEYYAKWGGADSRLDEGRA